MCVNGHCFDKAKSGYVNLLPPNRKNSVSPGDNKEMIQSRVRVMNKGYYKPLAEAIGKIFAEFNPASVLDAGCGTGYLCGELKKSFEDGSIQKSIDEFNAANTSKEKLYEFLHKNPENKIVKAAKKSDIVKCLKNSDTIDTRNFFDFDEVKGVKDKVVELYSQYKDAISKGETSENFFKGVRKLKRRSIIGNIGASILALGVITPAAMLIKRYTDKGGKEFQTKKEIKEQLIREGVITA